MAVALFSIKPDIELVSVSSCRVRHWISFLQFLAESDIKLAGRIILYKTQHWIGLCNGGCILSYRTRYWIHIWYLQWRSYFPPTEPDSELVFVMISLFPTETEIELFYTMINDTKTICLLKLVVLIGDDNSVIVHVLSNVHTVAKHM